MVVEVFIALIEGIDQSEGSIRLSQQQGPAVGGQFAALEIGLDVLAFEAGKQQGVRWYSLSQKRPF